MDIDEAARKVGIKRLPADAAGEQLFLHLAVRSAPKEQFARGEDRRSFFLWRLQRAIVVTGAAGFAACAALSPARRVYDLFSEQSADLGAAARSAGGDAAVRAHDCDRSR